MHPFFVIAPLLLGISAGLRTFVPFAVLMVATSFQFLRLEGTWLAFLGSPYIPILVVIASLGELIVDKLPFAPNRTAWFSLAGRILSGVLCGMVIMAALSGNSTAAAAAGAVIGVIGVMIGTFGGFYARTGLTKLAGIPDAQLALAEDLLAIGLAVLAIFLNS